MASRLPTSLSIAVPASVFAFGRNDKHFFIKMDFCWLCAFFIVFRWMPILIMIILLFGTGERTMRYANQPKKGMFGMLQYDASFLVHIVDVKSLLAAISRTFIRRCAAFEFHWNRMHAARALYLCSPCSLCTFSVLNWFCVDGKNVWFIRSVSNSVFDDFKAAYFEKRVTLTSTYVCV